MNYFDLHCDTAFECFTKGKEFCKNDLAISGEKADAFCNWHQVFAVWIKDNALEPFNLYKSILSDFKTKLKDKPQNLNPYFAVEGGAVLEDDADRVYTLKQDGIKFLTLTWNGENKIAGGADTEKDLTDFGKNVITKINKAGMVCDLSHLNEESFYSAAERSEKIIATHSNCYEICPHKRNLNDGQIKVIAEKKGVMGLCFYPAFLGEDVFDKIYRNIVYLCDKGYEDIIAIGSDFDGGIMDKKLDSVAKIPDLFCYLEQKGLEKRIISKIFYENAYNFIANL